MNGLAANAVGGEWLKSLPELLEWIRKHLIAAVLIVALGLTTVGLYQFIGSWAGRFGEAIAGKYGSFETAVASYTAVDTLLGNYLQPFNASRISVARFHNSIHDIANNPLFYVQRETAIVAPGISMDIDTMSLPAATFSAVLPMLYADRAVFIWTKDLRETALKELLKRNGTKAAIYVPVHDINGRVIGMISVQWVSDKDVPMESKRKEMVTQLQDAANRVGAYLTARSR